MEYNQGATRAEALPSGFLGAISNEAFTWVATFSGPGYDRTTMSRTKMIKLVQDHMSQSCPSKGKQKSTFTAGGALCLAGGAPDHDASRDASDVSQRVPSAPLQGKPGEPGRKENKMFMTPGPSRCRGGIQRQLETIVLLVDSVTICRLVTTHALRSHASGSSSTGLSAVSLSTRRTMMTSDRVQ